MELASYEQFAIPNERIEDIVPWLTDGLNLNAVYWNGTVAGITLPQYVEAVIDMAGGGAKSDTASGKNLKDASLTNGLTIRVPLFVESGERVRGRSRARSSSSNGRRNSGQDPLRLGHAVPRERRRSRSRCSRQKRRTSAARERDQERARGVEILPAQASACR